MDSMMKIAVIGTGWWATTAHIPGLLELSDVDVVLIDPNPDALKAAASNFGITHAYSNLNDALDACSDLKGAIAAVPHHAHYEVGRAVLESGLHLLIEKPMTLYAAHAKQLIELADAHGLHLMVGYFYPYLPLFRLACSRMEAGLIGDIEYITCSMSSMTIEFLRGNPEAYRPVINYPVAIPAQGTYSDPTIAGGGQGHLQVCHSTGLLFALANGLRAEAVAAFMNRLDTRVDVVDAFAVRMNNGAVATIGSTGNIAPGDPGVLEVHLYGSKGRLRLDLSAGHLYIRQHSGQEEHMQSEHVQHLGKESSQHFVNLILGRGENPAPARTVGLYSVELLDAAYRSASQNGQAIQIASLYEG
jgi:predicted dehydrogenase